jgi:hypothetical protein
VERRRWWLRRERELETSFRQANEVKFESGKALQEFGGIVCGRIDMYSTNK